MSVRIVYRIDQLFKVELQMEYSWKKYPITNHRYSALLAVLTFSVCINACAGSSLEFTLDPDAPLVGSHAAVESLSDSAYVAYIREGLKMVTEGHPWGERLVRFLDEKGKLTSIDQVMATSADPPGNSFWLAVHPPKPNGLMYYFRENPRALMLPRIPIGQVIAGLIFAHELQHAYDAIMFPDLTERGTANYVTMELNAYRLTVLLADHYTDGQFDQILRKGIENREFKRRRKWVLIPKRSLLNRLDALFGPPSPWEVSHRYPIFAFGLTYAECTNQVERNWATYTYLRMAGLPLPEPGSEMFYLPEQRGKDLACTPGESIESPITGQAVLHLQDRYPNSEWKGIILQGTGEDEKITVHILGIDATADVNAEVQRGDIIGVSQNPRASFTGISPHIHVEVYEDKRRINPWNLINERWPEMHEAYPTSSGNYKSKGSRWLKKGFKFEEDRDYASAIECYEEALNWPWWEVASTPIYHYIARCHTNLGNYREAVIAQQLLIHLL